MFCHITLINARGFIKVADNISKRQNETWDRNGNAIEVKHFYIVSALPSICVHLKIGVYCMVELQQLLHA